MWSLFISLLVTLVHCKHTCFDFIYTGTLSVTKNNILCERWDSKNQHALYSSIKELSLAKMVNYCRTFGSTFQTIPWCFIKTNNSVVTWEYCNIKPCTPSLTYICPEGYRLFASNCYKYYDNEQLSWKDASSKCNYDSKNAGGMFHYDGYLATIIHRQAFPAPPNIKLATNYWIGGLYRPESGGWVWSEDHQIISDTMWKSGSPEDKVGYCMAYDNFRSVSELCTTRKTFVCQLKGIYKPRCFQSPYSGTLSTTLIGQKCQWWNIERPHPISTLTTLTDEEKNNMHNYCRIIPGFPGPPQCYPDDQLSQNELKFAFCNLISCTDALKENYKINHRIADIRIGSTGTVNSIKYATDNIYSKRKEECTLTGDPGYLSIKFTESVFVHYTTLYVPDTPTKYSMDLAVAVKKSHIDDYELCSLNGTRTDTIVDSVCYMSGIKIRFSVSQILYVSEIEIYGELSSKVYVFKEPEIDMTLLESEQSDHFETSHLAVDGIINQDYNANSCSTIDEYGFWQINLDKDYIISHIIIYGQHDLEKTDMENFIIHVLIDLKSKAKMVACLSDRSVVSDQKVVSIECQERHVKAVRVSKLSPTKIFLCEVKLFGFANSQIPSLLFVISCQSCSNVDNAVDQRYNTFAAVKKNTEVTLEFNSKYYVIQYTDLLFLPKTSVVHVKVQRNVGTDCNIRIEMTPTLGDFKTVKCSTITNKMRIQFDSDVDLYELRLFGTIAIQKLKSMANIEPPPRKPVEIPLDFDGIDESEDIFKLDPLDEAEEIVLTSSDYIWSVVVIVLFSTVFLYCCLRPKQIHIEDDDSDSLASK